MYSFILHRTDFREYDQIITLYTFEKGKIEAQARGIKKIISKNSAYLEPFFLVEADIIPGKEINHLTKVVPVVCYKNILNDFNKMMLVKTVFSWLSVLIRNNEPDNKIFLLIKNWLEFLDSSAGVSAALGYGFLANLVSFLGFAPSLNSCAVCNEKNNLVGFYPAGGGVVCKKCLIIKKQEGAKVYPIRLVDLQAIKWLFSKQWDKVTEQNTEIANRLVFLYVQYHSEKKLVKIAKFD